MGLKELNHAPDAKGIGATTQDLKKIESISISLRNATKILGAHPTALALDKLMRDHFSGFTLAPDIREAILK